MLKGIILAAGYGSRFLPATKTLPKEMLPLIDKPIVEFILEEFLASGVKDIIVITSRRKKVLDDFFDREPELEVTLNPSIQSLLKPSEANICYIRQTEMLGTGQALLLARPWIGNEPVVVAYPDDLHVGSIPLTNQLIKRWEETGKAVLSTLKNPPNLHRYGVLKLSEDKVHVLDITEKPAFGKEIGSQASVGRFLYTPDFFDYLEEGWKKYQSSGEKGEYFHVYALKKLMEKKKVIYHQIPEEEYWDVGEPSGYFRAILRYAQSNKAFEAIWKEEATKV